MRHWTFYYSAHCPISTELFKSTFETSLLCNFWMNGSLSVGCHWINIFIFTLYYFNHWSNKHKSKDHDDFRDWSMEKLLSEISYAFFDNTGFHKHTCSAIFQIAWFFGLYGIVFVFVLIIALLFMLDICFFRVSPILGYRYQFYWWFFSSELS